jgi:hypothetical protein
VGRFDPPGWMVFLAIGLCNGNEVTSDR